MFSLDKTLLSNSLITMNSPHFIRRFGLALSLLFALICFPDMGFAQDIPEISAQWTAFHQSIDAHFVKDSLKFRLSASVKVDTADASTWGGLWARVDNKKGGNGFFDNMGDRSIKKNEWQYYVIEGHLNEQSDKLYVGGICFGNGKFYFDNFKLEIEREPGKYESVPLENPGFENKPGKNKIPGWTEGVNKKREAHVREFTISSTREAEDGVGLLLESSEVEVASVYTIGPIEGFSPQIGTLISMLNNLSYRVESRVQLMSMKETDYLYDSIANSVGALVMHLAAAEAFYQVFTFEDREFNEEEQEKWGAALELGEEARQKFRRQPISYYLEEYRKVREKTIEELKKRDDQWLAETREGGFNNHFAWFHVMEHQSSHLGQILMQTKRYPEEKEMMEYQLEGY